MVLCATVWSAHVVSNAHIAVFDQDIRTRVLRKRMQHPRQHSVCGGGEDNETEKTAKIAGL